MATHREIQSPKHMYVLDWTAQSSTNQITMYGVKAVGHSDEAADIYHPTLLLFSLF